jgi:hypothetical protein
VDDRVATIQALRERVAEGRPQLTKAFADARMRCEAVMLDAVATLERCRAAKSRREAHRKIDEVSGISPSDRSDASSETD